jgi:hypothetical protein
MPKQIKNDAERRMWVLNDEILYRQAQRQGGMWRYVRKNRKAIDEYIHAQLNRRPS